jgi:ABC-2 type transport system ATP-binding protein
VVLGKNGAGKTTLFRSMTGMLPPATGTIKFNGETLNNSRVKIAYLGHKDALPIGMKVKQIMEFYGAVEGADENEVNNAIDQYNLTDFLGRTYQNLSQGQRKRVALAKCLIGHKDIYILDEPTSNLDPRVSADIREFMTSKSNSNIILYSSHNMFEATEIGSQVIAINNGKLVYFGDISGVDGGNYRIGIRGTGIESAVTEFHKEGRFYIFDLLSASEAAELISNLTSKGARIYEVKDMTNPLERFFDDSN